MPVVEVSQAIEVGKLMIEYRNVIREARDLRDEIHASMKAHRQLGWSFGFTNPFEGLDATSDGFRVTVGTDNAGDPIRREILMEELDVVLLQRRVSRLNKLMARKHDLDARLVGLDLKDAIVRFEDE